MLANTNSKLRINTPTANIRGFTLIEIMIVVAIIGILASVAVPQYYTYVLETRRADAQVALLIEVQNIERCGASKQTYVGCNVKNKESPDSYYKIKVSTSARGYTLTATGQNQQATDEKCKVMTINHQSIRVPAPSTSDCWPN